MVHRRHESREVIREDNRDQRDCRYIGTLLFWIIAPRRRAVIAIASFDYRGKLKDRFKLMLEYSTRGRVCLYLEYDRFPARHGAEQAERKRIVHATRGSNSLQ